MRPYIEFKEGDPVRLVRDQPVGWRKEDKTKTYNERIMYYEGECIRLGPDEWKQLGTAQIQLISEDEYQNYWKNAPRVRLFACGVKNRLRKFYNDRIKPWVAITIFAILVAIICGLLYYR